MCPFPLSGIKSILLGKNAKFPQGNPLWDLTGGDGNIYQSANSAPGVVVGNALFSDVDYEGTITVEEIRDHDFVDVVFSFQVKIKAVQFRVISQHSYCRSTKYCVLFGFICI